MLPLQSIVILVPMIILGLNQVPGMLAWMHDSAAAIVKDGKIIATAEEERFNRLRHSRGNPQKAIKYCLDEAGIMMSDVDIIAMGQNPYAPYTRFRPSLTPFGIVRDFANLAIFKYFQKERKKETNAKIKFIDHHLAHAASTYYCSGYDEANVLTIDGSGETESFVFYIGRNGKLKRVWDIPLGNRFSFKKLHSIGMIYSAVTSLLGLGTNAEGKTMGLASYGKPVYDFSDILNIKSHDKYSIDKSKVKKLYGYLARGRYDEITQEHKNLAASLQDALEKSIVALAKESYEYSGIRNFALAGGVALNCNMNTLLLEQKFCDNLFIQPAAHDGGIALGAALAVGGEAGEVKPEELRNAYFGPDFSDDKIEQLLKESKLKYTKHKNIEEVVAKLVADGNIVGWFQGRMEMGPRALGNRSILSNPMIKDMDKRVNEEVKHRESWRPFAPSVTEESATKYFKGVDKAKNSPFMLHTFYLQDKYKDKFPAITHVDGSSRIQTVNKKQNKKYYKLLTEIGKLTGHSMVMNTSFNDNGEPIVCTPKDALKCYSATGFDAVALGSYLLKKPTCS